VALDGSNVGLRLDLATACTEAGDFEQGIHHLQTVLESDPACQQALYWLGVAYMQGGNPAAAIRHWQEALRLHPDDVQLRFSLAQALFCQSRHKKALAQVERVLKAEPGHVEALNLRGVVHMTTGDSHAALADFRACVRMGPPRTRGYFNLGLVYLQMRWMDAAALCFERAMRQGPCLDAEYHLACIRALRGDLVGACQQLVRTAAQEPNQDRCLLMLARLNAQRGSLEEACQAFRGALAVRNRAETFAGLGEVCHALGRYDEAVPNLVRALREPQEWAAEVRLLLADAYLRLGDSGQALATIQVGLKATPEWAAGHAMLGDVHLARGRRSAARAAWRKALKLAPENAELRRRLEES
jgi:tetratricopeptide (TPR) repeat protein